MRRENWRTMARQGIAEARGLLRTVLVNRWILTPVTRPPDLPSRKGPGRKPRFIYEFKGEASLSGLLAGLISARSVVTPTGIGRQTSWFGAAFEGIAVVG
jgi:hypothetical protein